MRSEPGYATEREMAEVRVKGTEDRNKKKDDYRTTRLARFG